MPVEFGVLGPIAAWRREPSRAAARGAERAAGQRRERGAATARRGAAPATTRLALKGPKQRAVLARLILARGEVVSVDRLVDDLWLDPPARAVGAIRTFVRDLRQALEPDRASRAPARILLTEGNGYVLATPGPTVDAWRFEHAVAAAATLPADRALDHLTTALGEWRGPAYAELADEHWTRAERARLTELRLHAVERGREARLALGRTAEAVGRARRARRRAPVARGRLAPARPGAVPRRPPGRCARGAAPSEDAPQSISSGSIPARTCGGSSRTSSATRTGWPRASSGCGPTPPPRTTGRWRQARRRGWSRRSGSCASSP